MTRRGVDDSEEPAQSAVPPASILPEVDRASATPTCESSVGDRRSADRIEVSWSVDCETEETFLYAAIGNISAMGIFVRTVDPLPIGTSVTMRFAPPPTREPFVLGGVVQWVNALRPRQDNPNPGMGIRFTSLTLADRERIVEAIHTIAYLREEPSPRSVSGGN